MPHNKDHKELLSLLQEDDRFTFNRDVGSLGQSFDNTFDLGENSPITRRATPPASQSLNDERDELLSLIPKPLDALGGIQGLFDEFRTETASGGVGPAGFNPPLRANPANVAGDPRRVSRAPLEELPTNSLDELELRGSPLDSSNLNQGTNTPEIALLLSSLGVAIGGDSIGGRIAGAAQQFAQQKVTANLSEKILSGETLTAKDLLGLDPKTALTIRKGVLDEEFRGREEERTERQINISDRGVGVQEDRQETFEEISATNIERSKQLIEQSAAKFDREQGFDAQGFFNEIGPGLGLDLASIDFDQIPLTMEQAKFVVQELSDVKQAGLNRQARLDAAAISGSGGSRGSFQERQFEALRSNPSTVPFLKSQKQQIEALLNTSVDDINAIDDPVQLRSMRQRLAELDELLLLLGENPSAEQSIEESVEGDSSGDQTGQANTSRVKILLNRFFGFPIN